MGQNKAIAPSKDTKNTMAIDHTRTPERTESMTPPATPSRAPTAPVIDSIECSIPMDTAATDTTLTDTSSEPRSVEFKPLQ
jgi:hypothetical protein